MEPHTQLLCNMCTRPIHTEFPQAQSMAAQSGLLPCSAPSAFCINRPIRLLYQPPSHLTCASRSAIHTEPPSRQAIIIPAPWYHQHHVGKPPDNKLAWKCAQHVATALNRPNCTSLYICTCCATSTQREAGSAAQHRACLPTQSMPATVSDRKPKKPTMQHPCTSCMQSGPTLDRPCHYAPVVCLTRPNQHCAGINATRSQGALHLLQWTTNATRTTEEQRDTQVHTQLTDSQSLQQTRLSPPVNKHQRAAAAVCQQVQ